MQPVSPFFLPRGQRGFLCASYIKKSSKIKVFQHFRFRFFDSFRLYPRGGVIKIFAETIDEMEKKCYNSTAWW